MLGRWKCFFCVRIFFSCLLKTFDFRITVNFSGDFLGKPCEMESYKTLRLHFSGKSQTTFSCLLCVELLGTIVSRGDGVSSTMLALMSYSCLETFSCTGNKMLLSCASDTSSRVIVETIFTALTWHQFLWPCTSSFFPRLEPIPFFQYSIFTCFPKNICLI